ncbi:MAG TPA: hypothetical protein VFR34_07765 [Paracoccaceae bacterium]|nr:hypothetical protein [Paracoccaceae bacterium]
MIRALAALALLAACKAERVEIGLTGRDLAAAIAGEEVTVPFTATFAQEGRLEEDLRAKLGEVERIARRHLAVTGFEVTSSEEGWQVTVRGEAPLRASGGAGTEPWRLWLAPNAAESPPPGDWPYALALAPTPAYAALEEEIRAVDSDLVPDAHQPITFTITATAGGFDFLAVAAEVDGELTLMRELKTPEAATVTFASDLYERLAPTLFLRPAR